MKKTIFLALLPLLAVLAGPAAAVQMFDFDAQALVPQSVGGAATVYGRIVNGQAVTAPLPLDFANHEYTVVVTGLVLDATGTTDSFSGGAVTIYEDAGTAADWAVPGSFTDGTAVLSGVLSTFQRTMLTATLGSGSGYVDWTGGTLLNLLAPADQLGWAFLTAVSRSPLQVEAGYDELWDGKLEPGQDVVATEAATWSGVKALFR